MNKLPVAFALIGLAATATPGESQAQYYSVSSSYGVEVVNTTQNAAYWLQNVSASQLLAEFLKLNIADPNKTRAQQCSFLAYSIALRQVSYETARMAGDWFAMIRIYYSIYELRVSMTRLGC